MSVDFPDNPTDGDTHTEEGATWTYADPPSAWIVVTAPIAETFLSLDDTPADYTGQAGKAVTVNGTESGLEFAEGGGGGPYFEEFHDPTNAASWRIVGTTLECWGITPEETVSDYTIVFPKSFARPPVPSLTISTNTPAATGAYVGFVDGGMTQHDAVTPTQMLIRKRWSTSSTSGVPSREMYWRVIGEWDGVS